MLNSFYLSLNLFWQLLRADICVYKQVLFDEIVDNFFWFISLMIVFSYVYSQMGMGGDFAPFFAVGSVVASPFWSATSNATNFLSDIGNRRVISYFLTLPISNNFLMIQKIVSYALRTVVPALFLLFLGKIFFWNAISWANFSVFRFSLIFILINLFCASFSLLIVGFVKNLQYVNQISIRFLFPLWFLGGANFSWQFFYRLSPVIARFALLNPLLYAFEGIHSAIEGPGNYLPFWLCVSILSFSIVLFTLVARFLLKKRLDFV